VRKQPSNNLAFFSKFQDLSKTFPIHSQEHPNSESTLIFLQSKDIGLASLELKFSTNRCQASSELLKQLLRSKHGRFRLLCLEYQIVAMQ